MARSFNIRLEDRFEAMFNENAEMIRELLSVPTLDAGNATRLMEAHVLLTNIILKEYKRRPKGSSSKEALRSFIFSRKAWKKTGTTLAESVAPIYEAFDIAKEELKHDMAALEEVEITESEIA